MQTIQLPTSTVLLMDQAFRSYFFTKRFDVHNPGPAGHYPQFLATFNKEAELNRLADVIDQLANGANVAIHIDREIVDA